MLDRILNAQQSEHCSYKSTKKYLSALHTKAPHVIQGPGENAGIIDIGNGYAIVLRIESHNHPSFISPYEGAATGVGGILRDIFTMGARPIALLDFLRFEETEKGCALLKEVVRGISDYGNCLPYEEYIYIKRDNRVVLMEIGKFVEEAICLPSTKQLTENEFFLTEYIETLSYREKPVWEQIRKVFKTRSKNLNKIQISSGRRYYATPKHPSIIYENDFFTTKDTQDLKDTDTLYIAKNHLTLDDSVKRIDLIDYYKHQDNIFIHIPRYIIESNKKYLRKAIQKKYTLSPLQIHRILNSCKLKISMFLELEHILNIDRDTTKISMKTGKLNKINSIIHLTPEFSKVLGLYIAEGCSSKHGNSYKNIWSFHIKEKDYINLVFNELSKILERVSIRHDYKNNSTQVRCGSLCLHDILVNILELGSCSKDKNIPYKLYDNMDILDGMFCGDGCFTFSNNRSSVKVSYGSISKTLIYTIDNILRNIGIIANYHEQKERKTIIHKKEYSTKKFHTLEIHNFIDIRNLPLEWFKQKSPNALEVYERKNVLYEEKFANCSTKELDHNLNIARISKNELYILQQDSSVYDIEVAGKHNFILGNGIITHNCTGIPVVGGDLMFHPSYRNNCLVNVCAIGLIKTKNIIYGRAMQEGNPLIYVGGRTGRDGIGGSEMASKTLVEMDESAIQSSDPFLEKLLIEACCELAETDWVEGMQDMGAAGLLCSTTEVVHRGRLHSNKNLGCFVDLDKVPLKANDMDLVDILLSESQERMLIVGKKEHIDDILNLFKRWDLQGCIIGEVCDGGNYHVKYKDKEIITSFNRIYENVEQDWPLVESKRTLGAAFDGHPSQIENIIHQYDYMIGGRTIKGPDVPGAYAILDIPEADTQLVISWGTGAKLMMDHGGADPKLHIRACFHKCLDSMKMLSAKPLAITNCMNFGHPENVIKDFKETIEGLNALCTLYDIPIISGNVSLYNCSETTSIEPTPIIVMVGTRPKLISGTG